jgi:hypothetical protein
MTPDIALFQYGYLLPAEDPRAPLPLSRVDEAGFDPEADLAGPGVLAPPRPLLTGAQQKVLVQPHEDVCSFFSDALSRV